VISGSSKENMTNTLTRNIFLIAALLTGCFFVSCENDMKEVDKLLKKKAAVDEALNVTSYMSQNGQMKAKLTSPFMLRYQGESQSDSAYMEFPRKLHVDFYNDSAIIESILDSKYARYREFERKVYLRDSVVVINIIKKDTLKTDELWWDQNKEEFYTDKNVEIRQPDKTIFGTGLKAGQDFSWYDIYHITGVVLTKDDDIPE
jgi:LPS export ABC transporter protein LptC